MTIEDQVAAGAVKAMKELTATHREEIKAAQSLLDKAQEELNTAKAEAESLGAKNKELLEGNAKLTADLKSATEAKAKLETDLEAANKRATELEQKEQDLDKRAGLKAAAILQSRGIKTPIAEDQSNDNPGSQTEGGELTGLARVEEIFAKKLAATRNK